MENFRYNSGNTPFSFTYNFRKNISASTHGEEKENNFNLQRKNCLQKISHYKKIGSFQIKSSKFSVLNKSLRHSGSQLTAYLNKQKTQFNQKIINGKQRLKQTYRGFLADTLRGEQILHRQEKLLSSKNKKISVNMNSKNLIELNETQGRQRVVNFFNVSEGFKKQNNFFNIQIKSSSCFDSVFPLHRIGATLISNEQQIYLYGGVVSIGKVNCFHQYDEAKLRWKLVQGHKGEIKDQNVKNSQNFGLNYHTAQIFKTYIIFVGGLSMILENDKKRIFSSSISIFETQRKEWSQIKWDKCLRSHATTIYANILIVYGGINQQDIYSDDLTIVSLNSNHPTDSRIIPWSYGKSLKQGIAYHKMINTYNVEPSFKTSLQIDGIIVYGGKFGNGQFNTNLSILRFNRNKQSGRTQILSKGWQRPNLIGSSPQDRYEHSFNILNNKAICVLVGGMNAYDQVLNDVWILDLCNSCWIKAIFDNQNTVIAKGICSHAATSIGTQILIYGGLNGQKKYSSVFFSIDTCLNRIKQQQSKIGKNDATKSKKIIKQFSLQSNY